MQNSQIPTKVPLPFADSGNKNVIPLASQIGITPGAASLTDGFPPLTLTPKAAGGQPPDGKDVNGILWLATAWARWQAAGGPVYFDATFSIAIGGYPAGAQLLSSASHDTWVNLVDGNTTNPDSSGAANWISERAFLAGYFLPKAATTGNHVTQVLTPTSSTSTMNTLTFTPSAPGLVFAVGSVNLGGPGQQPSGCTHQVSIAGSIVSSDNTTGPMTNHGIANVPAGTSVQIQQIYATPATSGSFCSTSLILTYTFVPE